MSARVLLRSILWITTLLITTACDRPARDALPLDRGPGAEAVELRRQIQEQAESICSTLGPSLPMLSITKTRVDSTERGLACLELTTPAERLGPRINPRSREEAEAPVAEWLARMGAAGLPVLRRALERPDGSEGERHLAFWAVARISAEQRPHPHGVEEARCLLHQWQEEAGRPLVAWQTATGFEPWPQSWKFERTPDGDPRFRPGPPLPAPYDQPRLPSQDLPDAELSQSFSGRLSDLRHQRRDLIAQATKALRDLRQTEGLSLATPPEELRSALAIFAVLRPEPKTLRNEVLPLADHPEVAAWTHDEDPFLALLASYDIEALMIVRNRLLSKEPRVREKHLRLLRDIAGVHGSECLLQSWASSSSEAHKQIFRALRATGSTDP